MPISLNRSQIGRGWRELEPGDPLTTFTQSFRPDIEVWVDATYLTKEGVMNTGRMNYRAPVSVGAWISAIWTALPKLWRRWVLRKAW